MSRGYSVLEKFQNISGLSDYGTAFVVKAADPYHDAPVPCHGIPDESNQRTVIREFKQTITVDSGPFEDTQWEFQVSLLPIGKKYPVYPGIVNALVRNADGDFNNNLDGACVPITTGTNSAPLLNGAEWIYPLTIVKNKSSTNPKMSYWPRKDVRPPLPPGNWIISNTSYQNITGVEIPFAKAEQQPYRLVAAGFEIINTTPAQYRGGVCTVYRPDYEYDGQDKKMYFKKDDTYLQGTEVHLVQTPFNTIEEAINVHGAMQWSADEGCYCVAPLDPTEMCRWTIPSDRTPLLFCNEVLDGPKACEVRTPSFNEMQGYSDEFVNMLISPSHLLANETVVAHFTGLQPQSTFQINVRWVIESIPDLHDDDNYLAFPSPPFDPIALEVYRQMVREMPAGCMVKDNPAGEWFARIMAILADFAEPMAGAVGTSLGGSTGGLIGTQVGQLVAGRLRNYSESLLASQMAAMKNTKM